MKLSIFSTSLLSLARTLNLAAIVVPGTNGSDGALNLTYDTVLAISKATTCKWENNNSANAANAGNCVYDPEKRGVVWLVSGNVIIAGTVDLSGESYAAAGITFDPTSQPSGGRLAGPGLREFCGGALWRGANIRQSAGFRPAVEHRAQGMMPEAEPGEPRFPALWSGPPAVTGPFLKEANA
jgi:hypothetical protein